MTLAQALGYFLSPLLLLVLGYIAGRIAEQRHYRNLQAREQQWASRPVLSVRELEASPAERRVASATLASGSVVVSVDYYKRFLAGLRMLFGGELRSYATLIERGRREAVLRMKESCPDAHAYLNCRLHTSTIARGYRDGLGSVEVLAYATAVRFADSAARLEPQAGSR
ncbi:MAG: YbjQ family protein [Proteobacteria bacterium]|nr:YbjQ family protein [Pseudomonadota bacterium]